MKKILLSTLSLIGLTCFGQNVSIPDANFKAYLVGNLAINTNSDTEIQVSEATAFTGIIDCGSMGVSDLTGIEAFTNLTELWCGFNSITTLDVSQNLNLVKLISQGNPYGSIDVTANVALTHLYCSSTQLSTLDVSQNTNLLELSCGDNTLTTIDVGSNVLLEKFYCQLNQLTTIDVSANPNLVDFRCHDNNLTSIDVSNSVDLELLHCSQNQITSLDLSANYALSDLRCGQNPIVSLDLTYNPGLTIIQCSQILSLTSLDLRNGTNTSITSHNFTNNPNLTCILVDDPVYSTANWTNVDPGATFSTTCPIGRRIYVNQNASGNNDGTSWVDAYTEFADALNALPTGSTDTIWVAQGTYFPIYDFTGNNSPLDPRSKEFFILDMNDLHIYGGFSGTETQLSQRNWKNNPTVLSGDIGTPGDQTDNCYSVFNSGNSNFVLDGFTVSDGYADGIGTGAGVAQKRGAGIIIGTSVSTVMRIENCLIKDNHAASESGLYMFMNGGTTTIDVVNTRFTGNIGRWAAPFSIHTYSGDLYPTFVNCLIDNNTTSDFNTESGNTFPGGRFIRQSAGTISGALINCTFTKNTETSTLADADRAVFGVQGDFNNTAIYNCIFHDNNVNTLETSVSYGGNAIWTPASVTVYNTISEDVMDNAAYITSTNNIQADPMFENPSSNDFTLGSSSAAINVGDTSGIGKYLPNYDLSYSNRFYGTAIDLGCYENQGAVNIASIEAEAFVSIYPNPTSGLLNFSNPINEVHVYELNGRLVSSKEGNLTQVDLSQLAKGMYLVELKAGEQIQTERIVVE